MEDGDWTGPIIGEAEIVSSIKRPRVKNHCSPGSTFTESIWSSFQDWSFGFNDKWVRDFFKDIESELELLKLQGVILFQFCLNQT